MVNLDVLTMGRISVDVYPLQVGVSLREVESFGKYLGGSSTNVAVAAARYGHRVATITRTGADPFGEFLHDALKGFGVDDRYVSAVPGLHLVDRIADQWGVQHASMHVWFDLSY